MLAALLSSCKNDSPSAIVEKAITAFQNHDYETYVDCSIPKPTNDKQKKEREAVIDMCKNKMPLAEQINGKIEKFEIISEEFKNDSIAIVLVNVKYSSSGEKEQIVETKKTKEGWKIGNKFLQDTKKDN